MMSSNVPQLHDGKPMAMTTEYVHSKEPNGVRQACQTNATGFEIDNNRHIRQVGPRRAFIRRKKGAGQNSSEEVPCSEDLETNLRVPIPPPKSGKTSPDIPAPLYANSSPVSPYTRTQAAQPNDDNRKERRRSADTVQMNSASPHLAGPVSPPTSSDQTFQECNTGRNNDVHSQMGMAAMKSVHRNCLSQYSESIIPLASGSVPWQGCHDTIPSEKDKAQSGQAISQRSSETKGQSLLARKRSSNSRTMATSAKESLHSHSGLPLDLRNKKMKPTDCLLYAATLLSTTAEPQKKTESSATTEDTRDPHSAAPDDPSKPREVDVLCGRGGLINKHPGNIIYRKVVDYNKPFYQRVHKKHRILVSQSIVQSILNFGGRFLTLGPSKNKSDNWIEVDYRRAVQKTSQALRERSASPEDQADDDTKQSAATSDGSSSRDAKYSCRDRHMDHGNNRRDPKIKA